MGFLGRTEKKVETLMTRWFAGPFRGDVEPVEITARLQRELDHEARLLDQDRKLVPNTFVVRLSRHDHDQLAPYSKLLNEQIVPQLERYATERHYIFNGQVSIGFELDAELPVGRFQVSSSTMAQVDAPDSDVQQLRHTRLQVEVNGVRHPLTPPSLTIGRGTDATIRINDPGVSRVHARIIVNGTGPDQQLLVEDAGSTNGMIVDGQRVRQAPLKVGSRIEIGSTKLTIVATAADV